MQSLAGLAGVNANTDAYDVVAAVVAALRLGDQAASGESPGGAYGVQGRLGAGVGEAHQVKAGDALAQQLRQPHLVPVGGVVHHTLIQLDMHGLHHWFRRVSQYQRRHGADKVQAVGAVSVNDVGPIGLVHKYGVWVPENGIPAVASGQVAFRFLPRFFGPWSPFDVAVNFTGHGVPSGMYFQDSRFLAGFRRRQPPELRALGSRRAAACRCRSSRPWRRGTIVLPPASLMER